MTCKPLVALVLLSAVASPLLGQGTRPAATGPAKARVLIDNHGRPAIDLAGQWEFLPDAGDKEMWTPDVAAAATWKAATQPGNLLDKDGRELMLSAKSFWLRRTFTVTARQARRDSVLKWSGIRFTPTVWINGRQVGQHVASGPHAILLPPGTLKEGENQIVIKAVAWSALPRSKSGFPLTPTGSGTESWGAKAAGIYDDIWIEFYDGVYIRHALAMPDLAKKEVTFRITLQSAGKLPPNIAIRAEIQPADDDKTLYAAQEHFEPSTQPLELRVPMKQVKPWSPDSPSVYRVRIVADTEGNNRDETTFTFAMREITVSDGHYQLNGKRVNFRGSNLVFEWAWGPQYADHPKEYLIDDGRLMNLNSFRTHTLPPPTSWLDVCDAHGMMIWAELPVLYNYKDFKFTPQELEVWHRNVLADSAGWVAKLWNHPSIVIWVLSNESDKDNAWESSTYWKHVRDIDPTRPTLRTGEPKFGTGETVDIHTCGNFTRGAEGEDILTFRKYARLRDPARPLSNSEYMNVYGDPSLIWLGKARHPDAGLNMAEFCMEHTEAMRRLDYDGVLPYMYAGWTSFGRKWRDDFPTPMAACLHSVMSPVAVSLDMFDRNYTPGQEVKTPLHLINDDHADRAVVVELYLTPKNPLFVPDEDALKAAVWKDKFDATLKASSSQARDIAWAAPAKEGVYYLAAVLRRDGDRPVVSQRIVRVMAQPGNPGVAVAPAASGPATATFPAGGVAGIAVIGADEAFDKYASQSHMAFTKLSGDDKLDSGTGTILIWSAARIDEKLLARAGEIRGFVEAGGRVVIMDQQVWKWTDLLDVQMEAQKCSRAFAHEAAAGHWSLAGIDGEYLKRWNGLPGTIASNHLTGKAVKDGKPILWSVAPANTVLLSVPVGKGEIVFSMLDIRGRLERGSRKYDVVAERIFRNLTRRP